MTSSAATGFDAAQCVEDRAAVGFCSRHEAVTGPALCALEMSRILESTRVCVVLTSELAKPHDHLTRQVGRVPVLLSRDGDGRQRFPEQLSPPRHALGPVPRDVSYRGLLVASLVADLPSQEYLRGAGFCSS